MKFRYLAVATFLLVPTIPMRANDTFSDIYSQLSGYVSKEPVKTAQYAGATAAVGCGIYKFGWKGTLAIALVVVYRKEIGRYIKTAVKKIKAWSYLDVEQTLSPAPSAPSLEDLDPEPSAPSIEVLFAK